jgi:hypothetical protein
MAGRSIMLSQRIDIGSSMDSAANHNGRSDLHDSIEPPNRHFER